MAQLNSRGTLTRGRWDYFEHSNGWASVYGSVTSGGIGAYFANNSTATMQLDIYALYWFASVATIWNVTVFVPPLVLTSFTPTESQVHATQLDRATPPGVVGMYSASASPFFTIQRGSNSQSGAIVQPVPGQPFITLPPSWAIGVGGFGGANPIELSLNVFFQEVVDNVAPAP